MRVHTKLKLIYFVSYHAANAQKTRFFLKRKPLKIIRMQKGSLTHFIRLHFTDMYTICRANFKMNK